MKRTLTLIIFIVTSLVTYSQTDSVKLKITKVRTQDKQVRYWFEDIKTKARYYTVCECLPVHKKGELVTVLRKEMEFITKD